MLIEPGECVTASLMAKLDAAALPPRGDHVLLATATGIIKNYRGPGREPIPKDVQRRCASQLFLTRE